MESLAAFFAGIDFRFLFAYPHSAMTSMGSGVSSNENQRENRALLIAACIVAAIRLRGQEVRPSPKLTAVIKDSVMLARLVLAELLR